MKAQLRLVKVLNDAIEIGLNNIHFTLENNGLILIQLRSGNLMLPYLHITEKKYKQILDYIELHTTFEPFSRGQPQMGVLILNDNQKVLECCVSILPTTKIKSLVLRIKKPNIKRTNLKKNLENLPSGMLEIIFKIENQLSLELTVF